MNYEELDEIGAWLNSKGYDIDLLLDADGAASIYELDKLFSLPKRGAGVAIMGTRFSKSSEVVAKTGLRAFYRDWETKQDRKSTRLNSSHRSLSRMPSSA